MKISKSRMLALVGLSVFFGAFDVAHALPCDAESVAENVALYQEGALGTSVTRQQAVEYALEENKRITGNPQQNDLSWLEQQLLFLGDGGSVRPATQAYKQCQIKFFKTKIAQLKGQLAETSAAQTSEPANKILNQDSQKQAPLQARQEKQARQGKPKKPEDDHAPYLSGKCVRFVQGGQGVADAFKRIHNDCSVPVAVTFCLQAPGPISQCLDRNRYGLSDTIRPGKSALTADAIQGPWTAWFFVCDMSNPKKQTCLPPKDIAGSGAFRD